MSIVLTKHIRALRGGSQPHLMQASNGIFYVVKFQNNPQGTAVLINELLAAKIAGILGLPVPSTEVVELPPGLAEDLYFETSGGREPIRPGCHLGSRLVISNLEGRSYDSLPRSFQHLIRNTGDLSGIQLFDLWTNNRDTRQAVYWKRSRDKMYTVTFIDNGHCFGGPEWKFCPLVTSNFTVADSAKSLSWFRWADRVATFPMRWFESSEVDNFPPEWFDGKNKIATVFKELRIRQAIIADGIKCRASRTLGNRRPEQPLSWLRQPFLV